jgi:hypothetical protein
MVVQTRVEYMANAERRCAARRYGLTLGTSCSLAGALSPERTIHHPMKPCTSHEVTQRPLRHITAHNGAPVKDKHFGLAAYSYCLAVTHEQRLHACVSRFLHPFFSGPARTNSLGENSCCKLIRKHRAADKKTLSHPSIVILWTVLYI